MKPLDHVALLLLPAFLLACSGDSAPRPVDRIDLVQALETAQIDREVRHLDLGTPEARPHLWEGWSWDEQGDGMTFVWATGPRSVMTFFLTSPRPLRATLRCFPFRFAGSPEQGFVLTVNGHALPRQPMPRSPTDLVFEMPGEVLRSGTNRLELLPDYHRSPKELGNRGGDHDVSDRDLSAGCDFLRLGGAHQAPPAQAVEAPEPRILLPFGTQVSYFLPLTTGSALEFSSLRFEGGGEFEILLRPETGEETLLLESSVEGRDLRLELPASGLVSLVFRALGETPWKDEEGFHGVALGSPTLLVPRDVDPTQDIDLAQDADPTQDIDPALDTAPTQQTAPEGAAASSQRPHIILYLVDTLRADVLGAYGHDRPTTPRLDAFAQEAFLFEHALAQSSWTRPSVASILTGLDPMAHGTDHLDRPLGETVPNLAESLRQLGYRTAAIVSNGHITVQTGFDRGFDHFVYAPEESPLLTEMALEHLSQLVAEDDQGPIFLYLHTIDPHAPFVPSDELRSRWAPDVQDRYIGSFQHLRDLGHKRAEATPEVIAALRALYDAEVAGNDAAFGDFLDGIAPLLPEDRTAVAFLSDHGDAFHERQIFGHGWDLYAEVLHVPLVLRLPGMPGGRRLKEPVQHADLFPTLLTLAGGSLPQGLGGRNLLPWLRGEQDLQGVPLFSHMDYEGRAAVSVESGGYKLHLPLTAEYARLPLLFHRRADPGELQDLAQEQPILAGHLATLARERLAATDDQAQDDAPVELSDEARKQLEALGYIQ